MNKKAAIYARVSTDDQATENQIAELTRAAERHGWEIVARFVDEGVSGAKGRDQRPQFDALCKAAVRREFDVVMAWSVDRLGRSLQHLVEFLNDIDAKGVDLYLHQQGIDTTTPSGKAMFQMCAVFSEFERAMIRERVKAGIQRAREKGTKSGRPIGRPKLSQSIERRVLARRAKGQGIRSIARELGVGNGTVERIVNNITRI